MQSSISFACLASFTEPGWKRHVTTIIWIILRQVAIQRILQVRNAQIIEPSRARENFAGRVSFTLHQGKPWRRVAETAATGHDQFVRRIAASPLPNRFDPSVAVDCGEVDAELAA